MELLGFRPTLEIAEQPDYTYRCRYEGDGRRRPVTGVHSTAANTTYPAIRVNNHVGPVKIQVSCVTKDPPYMPHPFELVGNHCGDTGVCCFDDVITAEKNEVPLQVTIQRVKKEKVFEALQLRALHQVDPFGSILPDAARAYDLKYVRLAVLVLAAPAEGSAQRRVLGALAFDPITHTSNVLEICNNSAESGPACGGTKLILLTEKLKLPRGSVVTVRFEEQETGWTVDVKPEKVHRTFAVVLTTPPYHDPEILVPANVEYYLHRTNTGDEELDRHPDSNPQPFKYMPKNPAPTSPPKKRRKAADKRLHHTLQEQQLKFDLPQPPLPSSTSFGSITAEDWALMDEYLIEKLFGPPPHVSNEHNITNAGEPSEMVQHSQGIQMDWIGQHSPIEHDSYSGKLSLIKQTSTSGASSSEKLAVNRQSSTTTVSSSKQPSVKGKTSGTRVSSYGQLSLNRQTSITRTSSSGQPTLNRQTSTTTVFSSEQPSLIRKTSTTKVFSSEQPSLNRQTSTSRASSSGQPSLNRQTSTTRVSSSGQPSLNRQTSTSRASSSGQPSLNRQTSTSRASSSGQPSLDRQTSTTRTSSFGQLFLNTQTSITEPLIELIPPVPSPTHTLIHPSIAPNSEHISEYCWRLPNSLLDSPCPSYTPDQLSSSEVSSWVDCPEPNFTLDQPSGSGLGVQLEPIVPECRSPMDLPELQQPPNGQQEMVHEAASTTIDSDILQLDDLLNIQFDGFLEVSDPICDDFGRLSAS